MTKYLTPTVRYRVPPQGSAAPGMVSNRDPRHGAGTANISGVEQQKLVELQKAFDADAQEEAALARCRETIAIIRGHARWCQQTGLPVLLAALGCALAGMILPALATMLQGMPS